MQDNLASKKQAINLAIPLVLYVVRFNEVKVAGTGCKAIRNWSACVEWMSSLEEQRHRIDCLN